MYAMKNIPAVYQTQAPAASASFQQIFAPCFVAYLLLPYRSVKINFMNNTFTSAQQRVLPNPSLKWSVNGLPPGPGRLGVCEVF
jgi:hypothetical protein